jgi:hypothetical protein
MVDYLAYVERQLEIIVNSQLDFDQNFQFLTFDGEHTVQTKHIDSLINQIYYRQIQVSEELESTKVSFFSNLNNFVFISKKDLEFCTISHI